MLGTSTSRYSLLRAVAGEGEGGGGGGDDGSGEGNDDGAGEGEGDDQHGDVTELSTKELADLKKRAAEAEQAAKRLKEFERNNKRLTDQAKKAEAQLDRVKKLGTPEEIEEMLAERERIEEQRAKESGQIEQLLEKERQRRRDAEKVWEEKYNNDTSALQKRIDELTLGHRLRDGLTKVGVRDELLDPALDWHRKFMRKATDEDEPDGYRWVGQLGETELSVEDYLKVWAENDPNAPAWLKPSINTGAGAPGSAGNGRAERKPRSKMTTAEKAKFIEDHGEDRYWKLPA